MLLPILLLLLLLLQAACDEPPGAENNLIRDDLVFVRPGGSRLSPGSEYAICCGEREPGLDARRTLKLWRYSAIELDRGWKLFVVLDDVVPGGTYAFPTGIDGGPVQLFVLDGANELSSGTVQSGGTMIVHEIDCGPPLRVRLTLDAVIGSELAGGPTLTVTGDFEATVHANPTPGGCDFGI